MKLNLAAAGNRHLSCLFHCGKKKEGRRQLFNLLINQSNRAYWNGVWIDWFDCCLNLIDWIEMKPAVNFNSHQIKTKQQFQQINHSTPFLKPGCRVSIWLFNLLFSFLNWLKLNSAPQSVNSIEINEKKSKWSQMKLLLFLLAWILGGFFQKLKNLSFFNQP